MSLFEGKHPKEKLLNEGAFMGGTFASAYARNWMVWPWVQVVNFKFVPLQHRVLVVNAVALGWNCYLSYLNSGGGGGDKAAEQEAIKEG